jgi:hypothetical protein
MNHLREIYVARGGDPRIMLYVVNGLTTERLEFLVKEREKMVKEYLTYRAGMSDVRYNDYSMERLNEVVKAK